MTDFYYGNGKYYKPMTRMKVEPIEPQRVFKCGENLCCDCKYEGIPCSNNTFEPKEKVGLSTHISKEEIKELKEIFAKGEEEMKTQKWYKIRTKPTEEEKIEAEFQKSWDKSNARIEKDYVKRSKRRRKGLAKLKRKREKEAEKQRIKDIPNTVAVMNKAQTEMIKVNKEYREKTDNQLKAQAERITVQDKQRLQIADHVNLNSTRYDNLFKKYTELRGEIEYLRKELAELKKNPIEPEPKEKPTCQKCQYEQRNNPDNIGCIEYRVKLGIFEGRCSGGKGRKYFKPIEPKEEKDCMNCRFHYNKEGKEGNGCTIRRKELGVEVNECDEDYSEWKPRFKKGDKCIKCDEVYINYPESINSGICLGCRNTSDE
jgi:hypothetical protein